MSIFITVSNYYGGEKILVNVDQITTVCDDVRGRDRTRINFSGGEDDYIEVRENVSELRFKIKEAAIKTDYGL